jgi:glycogen synthase
MLTADYPPDVWSGIGVAVHRQSEDLAALGAEVTVLTSRGGGEAAAAGHPEVVAIRSDAPLPAVRAADWIHVHSLALTELALELRRLTGARLAYTVHTQPWLELPGHPRRRFWLDVQARLLGACDAVIFLSAGERAAAAASFARLPAVHVIPNGVPPPPAIVPLRDRRPVAVFAGRATLGKGIDLVAACVRRVREISRLRFLIAAGHGDRAGVDALTRLAREPRDGCEVAGWLSRAALDDHLAHARVVLVPSRYEPFGLVALEAMRLATPVLASDIGGLRDTVRPGSGGLRLDSFDPQRWAAETVRVAGDAALWTTLHEQGPQFVHRHYRGSDLAARLVHDVYRQPMNNPSSRGGACIG